MTNPITAEQARELLDGATCGPRKGEQAIWYLDCYGPEESACDIRVMGSEMVICECVPAKDAPLLLAAPDLARTVIAQDAELTRLRADLAKAVGALKPFAQTHAWAPDTRFEIVVAGQYGSITGADLDRARTTLSEITHD